MKMKYENKIEELLSAVLKKDPRFSSWVQGCSFYLQPGEQSTLGIFPGNKFVRMRLEGQEDYIQKILSHIGNYRLKILSKGERLELEKQIKTAKIAPGLPLSRQRWEAAGTGSDPRRLFFLRIIDILTTLPSFEENILVIRKELGISTAKTIKSLEGILGKRRYSILEKVDYAWPLLGFELGLLEDVVEIRKEKRDWEQKQFPSLIKKIAHLRLNVLGKIPGSWNDPIIDYALYGKMNYYPVLSRKSSRLPRFDVGTDPDTFDPCIEIRIYGDTDLPSLRKLTNLKNLKKVQQVLPTYQDIDEKIENNMLQRFIYFYGRDNKGLTHKGANGLLECSGFKPIHYDRGSQERKRFQEMFLNSKKVLK